MNLHVLSVLRNLRLERRRRKYRVNRGAPAGKRTEKNILCTIKKTGGGPPRPLKSRAQRVSAFSDSAILTVPGALLELFDPGRAFSAVFGRKIFSAAFSDQTAAVCTPDEVSLATVVQILISERAKIRDCKHSRPAHICEVDSQIQIIVFL